MDLTLITAFWTIIFSPVWANGGSKLQLNNLQYYGFDSDICELISSHMFKGCTGASQHLNGDIVIGRFDEVIRP